MKIVFKAFLLLVFMPWISQGQENCAIRWDGLRRATWIDSTSQSLHFAGAGYREKNPLPWFEKNYLDNPDSLQGIDSYTFVPLTAEESIAIGPWIGQVPHTLYWEIQEFVAEKKPGFKFSLLPFIYDSLSGQVLKLKSFQLNFTKRAFNLPTQSKQLSAFTHSVLAQGRWYKLGVTQSGIFKLDASFLQSLGIDLATADPAQFGIFGGNGKMLPEANSKPSIEDPQELAIQVKGESDGRFDPEDAILFYASGPVSWNFNSVYNQWEHSPHLYSDTVFYFFSPDQGSHKRIVPAITPTPGTAIDEVSSFDFMTEYDEDVFNLGKTGRRWFGELYDVVTEQSHSFYIPEQADNKTLGLKISTAANASVPSGFNFSISGQIFSNAHYAVSSAEGGNLASPSTIYKTVQASAPIVLDISYNKPNFTAKAWLDYIDLQARCKLYFKQGQLPFADHLSAGPGKQARFTLQNAAGKATIWDVSDPFDCREIEPTTSGTSLQFLQTSDLIRNYIAFEPAKAFEPIRMGTISNQDVHGINQLDMVIVTARAFKSQALRLAAFHTLYDNLSVTVLEPGEVYNEFSAGTPDIAAIRNMMRYFYRNATSGQEPKYLLLFGDGSYDYKDHISGNTNFVPTWQSAESFDPVSSTCTDDFFGILDENEGTSLNDRVDLGVGRIPVKSEAEAKDVVDKILYYATADSAVRGDWRNVATFIADDDEEHTNEHIQDSESLVSLVQTKRPDLLIDKIYMDAFVEVSVPNGKRYPDVNKAISQRMEKGCLLMNYTGHGGETGLAHEDIMNTSDINNWENKKNMPVFVTATCEFSRFDDPERVSAGEMVLLNPKGGGVALFSTTRATYGSPNYQLSRQFYQNAIPSAGQTPLRLGDIIKKSKQEAGADDNGRKFVLIGDPALTLAFAKNKVVTDSINGKPPANCDTLKAFSQIEVVGHITTPDGMTDQGFNGYVIPSVFDKPMSINTLANDGGQPYTFSITKNLIYRGKVEVTNGQFRFKFIVPKDIAYPFGKGMISYYASSSGQDACGSLYPMIGGMLETTTMDETGPQLSLYMNDERFVDGGLTDPNPWMIAKTNDQSGINTIGSGIGHDLTAVLDDDYSSPYILNNYYVSDVGSYQSGSIHFPFTQLAEGDHTLKVKVWDIANNSTEGIIHFKVYPRETFAIQKAYCYPNPFSTSTSLVFEHNQKNVDFDINLYIYNLQGQLVKKLSGTAFQDGSVSTAITWDGRNEQGVLLPAGLYLFRLDATTSDGLYNQASGRIIFAH